MKSRRRKMRALLVDDGRTGAIRETLSRAGFEVLESSDGQRALDLLEDRGPVDLALVDWDLPREGGHQFVRSVRSCRNLASVRLVMMTGGLDTAEILEAIRIGVDDHLVRPITRRKLLEKLALLRLGPG